MKLSIVFHNASGDAWRVELATICFATKDEGSGKDKVWTQHFKLVANSDLPQETTRGRSQVFSQVSPITDARRGLYDSLMNKRFRVCSLDQVFLLPPSLQDWLPEEHLARFIADVVNEVDCLPTRRKCERSE